MGKCKEYREREMNVPAKCGNYHWTLIRATMNNGNSEEIRGN